MPVYAKVLKNWSEIKTEIDRKSNYTNTTTNSATTDNNDNNNNAAALSLSTSTTSLNKLSLLSTAVEQHNINMQASQQYNNNNTTNTYNSNTYNNRNNNSNNMLYALKTPTSQDSRGSGSELYVGGFSSSDPSLTPNTPIHNNNSNNNTTTTTATCINSANTAAYITPPSINRYDVLNPNNSLSVPGPDNPTPTLSYVFTPLGTLTSSNSEVASVIPPTNLLPRTHNKPTHDNSNNSSNAYTHKSTATPSHIANTFNLSLQAFRRNMKYPSTNTTHTNSVYNTNTTNNNNINTNNNNSSNNMYTPHTNSPILKNTSSYTKNIYTNNSNTNTYTNNTNTNNIMYIHDTSSPRSTCLPNLSVPSATSAATDLNLTLPSPQVTRQALHKHTSTNNISNNINDNSGSNNNYSNLNTNKRDIYYNSMQYIHRSGNICIRFAPNGFVWVINLTTHEKEKNNIYNNYILFIKFVESVDICMDIVDDLINDVLIYSCTNTNNTDTTASNSNTNTAASTTINNDNGDSVVNVFASVETGLGSDI